MNVALYPAEPLNFISLCTGGGGLDLGVELAIPNARPIVFVEREAFAVARLVSAMEDGLMASAPVWSDVRTFNGRPWRSVVDGVIGGIPCQPHSVAGKRLGADDERDLWADARRIIVQSGAWWTLIENVEGMLSTGGFERVCRDLRRLGFDVEAGLFTSAEVGAPHQRKRLFIMAVARCCCNQRRRETGDVPCAQGQTEIAKKERQRSRNATDHGGCDVGDAHHARLEGRGRCGMCERAGEWTVGQTGGAVANAARERRGEGRPKPIVRSGRDAASRDGGSMGDTIGGGYDGVSQDTIGRAIERIAAERSKRSDLPIYPPGPSDIDAWREIIERAARFEPAVCRVADGMAGRVDQLRMLGNGVNPLQAAYAVRTLATRHSRRSARAGLSCFLNHASSPTIV